MTQKNFKYPFTTRDFPYTDPFGGNDGDKWDEALWSRGYASGTQYVEPSIYQNELRFQFTGTATVEEEVDIDSSNKFSLSDGDFDVQCDFRLVSSTNNERYIFRLMDDSNFFVEIRVAYDTDKKYIYEIKKWNGSIYETLQSGNVTRTLDTGKVRVTRVGDTFKTYYWNGSTWAQMSTYDYSITFSPYVLHACVRETDAGVFDVRLSNFTINSAGGVDWKYKFIDTFEGGVEPVLLSSFDFNGSVPSGDTTYWSGHNLINNELNLASPTLNGSGGSSTLRYKFTGNFSVSAKINPIQWDLVGTDWSMQFRCKDSVITNNMVAISSGPSSGALKSYPNGLNAGSYVDWVGAPGPTTTSDPFWVRITRNGTTFSCEYSANGTTWSHYNGSPKVASYMGNVVYFSAVIARWGSTTQLEYGIDDFTVLSGAYEWDYDWSETSTENWWIPAGQVNMTETVLNNELTLTSSYNNTSATVGGVTSNFQLVGDFDITVDFTQDALSVFSDYIRMDIVDPLTNDTCYVSQGRNSGGTQTARFHIHDTTFIENNGIYNTVGKFRITRVGSSVDLYYIDPMGGQTLGNTDATFGTVNVKIHLWKIRGINSSVKTTGTFSNFIINSCDRIIWPGGTLKRWNGSAWVPATMNRYATQWGDSMVKRYVSDTWEYVGNVE